MSTLQVRGVPEEVSRTLKARASASGQSLSEYVLAMLHREASQPTVEELLDRVSLRAPVDIGEAAVDWLRKERDDQS